MAKQVKYRLTVYGAEGPRYAKGNCLWWREYWTATEARRAAGQLRKRFPSSVAEIAAFHDHGFWVCNGGSDVTLLWNDAA